MARICMLSVQHSPLDDRINFKEAQTLVKSGHEVVQVCAANPEGELYDMGDKELLNRNGEREILANDIPTTSVPLPRGVEKLTNKLFLGRYQKDYLKAAIDWKADVYHCHEPLSLYFGIKAGEVTGAKVVFDSHESWVEGRPKEQFIQRTVFPKLKFLISANQLTRGYLTCLNRNLESEVIYNAAEPQLYEQVKASQSPLIVHDGNLPFNRGLKLMLESIKLLRNAIPEVKLKLIGETSGAERDFLTSFVREHELEQHVYETGWVNYNQVAGQLNEASIGIIAKEPTTNNVLGGPPIKYYNYLAAGLAIVDVNMPETTRLLSMHKCGVSLREHSPELMADTLQKMLNNKEQLMDFQQSAKTAFASLNWQEEGKKLIRFYDQFILNEAKTIYYS